MPDPASNAPEEAANFVAGLGAGMTEAIRRQLWEAYQAGSTRMAGAVDPVLVTAAAMRGRGVVIASEEEFNEFVAAYGLPDGRPERVEHFMARKRAADSSAALSASLPAGGSVADAIRTPAASAAAGRTRAENPGVPSRPAADADAGWYAKWRDLNNRRDAVREGGGELPPDEEAEWDRLTAAHPEVAPPGHRSAAPPPGGTPPAASSTTPPPPAPPTADNLRSASAPTPRPGPADEHTFADTDLARHPPEPAEAEYHQGMRPPGEPDRAQSPTAAFDRPQPVIVTGPRPLPVTVDNLRDALSKQSREARDPEPGKEPKIGPSLLEVLAGASAGHGQSGSNLAGGLLRGLGIGSRARARGRQLGAKWWKGSKTGPKSWLGRKVWGTPQFKGGKFTGNVGGLLGQAPGAAGAGVGAVLGPVGLAAGAITTLGTAAVEAGKAVYAFARAQEQEVRRLAEVGGEQALAVAQLDANRVMRDVKTAESTGGSSAGLIASLDKLEDGLQPLEAELTNLANTIGSELVDTLSTVVDAISPLTDVLKSINEVLGGEAQKQRRKDAEVSDFAVNNMRALQQEMDRIGRPQWPAGPGRR